MWYKFSHESYKTHIELPSELEKILKHLKSSGMNPFLIGGSVRDQIHSEINTHLPHTPKDYDIEVYNTTYENLENLLKSLPNKNVDSVGKSFGVIKFRSLEDLDYDFSIPRRENKIGQGHKGFRSEFDPSITPQEGAARRDFTINALAWDPFTKEVLDYFNGIEDIKNKILRHTSGAFSEDPLRVLRAIQIANRMGLKIAPETIELAKKMLSEYSTLSKERIEAEWAKLIGKGLKPGDAIDVLKDTNWIDHYPEIKDLVGVKQTQSWHPEGDVDTHTLHVMNSAAEIADREGLKGDDRAVLIYAALCHDLGKPSTTKLEEKDGEMVWTAKGHEQAGGPLTQQLLDRIGVKKSVIARVIPLVTNHMQHLQIQPRLIPRLADDLYPATIQELSWLIEADHSGRPPLPKETPKQALDMLEIAKTHGVHSGKPTPFITWQDLLDIKIDVNKMVPSIDNNGNEKKFPLGRVFLDNAYKNQLKGTFNNRDGALMWLKKTAMPYALLLKGNHPIFNQLGISGATMGKALMGLYEAQLAGKVNNESEAEIWIAEHFS